MAARAGRFAMRSWALRSASRARSYTTTRDVTCCLLWPRKLDQLPENTTTELCLGEYIVNLQQSWPNDDNK